MRAAVVQSSSLFNIVIMCYLSSSSFRAFLDLAIIYRPALTVVYKPRNTIHMYV